MENKEYKNIPMSRPGKDYFLNGLTCTKDSYEKVMNSDKVKELLKIGSLFITYNDLYEINKDMINAITIDPADPFIIGHVSSIDIEHNTCDIAIRDNKYGLKARKELEDKENIFCIIGLACIGNISNAKEKTFDLVDIGHFQFLPIQRNTDDKEVFDYYKIANYPVEGTYYDPNNK